MLAAMPRGRASTPSETFPVEPFSLEIWTAVVTPLPRGAASDRTTESAKPAAPAPARGFGRSATSCPMLRRVVRNSASLSPVSPACAWTPSALANSSSELALMSWRSARRARKLMPLLPSVPKKPISKVFADGIRTDGAVTTPEPGVYRPLEAATGCLASTPE
jgi:hypothetical protein